MARECRSGVGSFGAENSNGKHPQREATEMSEIAMMMYGPLIDHVGQWGLGLIAFYTVCRLVRQYFEAIGK
jgi:hypothetical protein